MRRNLVGLTSLLAMIAIEARPAPAEACGIKLIVKTNTPRKAVARSSNPSNLLLVGTPPRRLERELTAAGHRVEVAKSPTNATKKQYAVVVVTDPGQADEARATFPSSTVVVRSGDVANDIASVERQVRRTPVRTADGSRNVVAARQVRQPIAAGPVAPPQRTLVTAKEPTDEAPAPTPAVAPTPPAPTPPAPTPPAPTPPPKEVVAVQPKTVETPARRPAPPAPATKSASFTGGEIYFGLASASVRNAGTVQRAARWLTDNADAGIVIEGHADPSGNPDANQALSQSRAEAVRDALVAAGIDASRIEVVGYGSTKLKYGATDGRNRRVAILPKK